MFAAIILNVLLGYPQTIFGFLCAKIDIYFQSSKKKRKKLTGQYKTLTLVYTLKGIFTKKWAYLPRQPISQTLLILKPYGNKKQTLR